METSKDRNILTVETLLQEKFEEAMTYAQFRSMVDTYAKEGRTSGPEQKESYIEYTVLNSRRMKRWDKTFKLDDAAIKQIAEIKTGISWLVITETWCGDAAPSMPVMNKIALASNNIELKVLLRDENLDLMDHFRTNGNLSIPKLISFDDKTGSVIGEWGPLPTIASKIAADYKQEHDSLTPEFKEELQRWFNQDKGKDTLSDLLSLLALE